MAPLGFAQRPDIGASRTIFSAVIEEEEIGTCEGSSTSASEQGR
jgi:hypothetical protein